MADREDVYDVSRREVAYMECGTCGAVFGKWVEGMEDEEWALTYVEECPACGSGAIYRISSLSN